MTKKAGEGMKGVRIGEEKKKKECEAGSGREYAGGCGAAAIGLRQELECE